MVFVGEAWRTDATFSELVVLPALAQRVGSALMVVRVRATSASVNMLTNVEEGKIREMRLVDWEEPCQSPLISITTSCIVQVHFISLKSSQN